MAKDYNSIELYPASQLRLESWVGNEAGVGSPMRNEMWSGVLPNKVSRRRASTPFQSKRKVLVWSYSANMVSWGSLQGR